jgi:hypothetical protein
MFIKPVTSKDVQSLSCSFVVIFPNGTHFGVLSGAEVRVNQRMIRKLFGLSNQINLYFSHSIVG